MQGLIFSIKRYSIHDGPGIRVAIFMKGCPLSCWWCHNPEGISPGIQEMEESKRVGEKEFSRKELVGKYYTIKDILSILDRERIFMKESDGGVTFTGGEPLMQAEFLLAALKACKSDGFHTAVDTSGYGNRDSYSSIIPYTDLFLMDIKHLDDSRHIEYTGVSNSSILENYKLLLGSGKDIIVRIPLIPGKNDDSIHLEQIRSFISGLKTESLKKINLLPFHRIGVAKYRKLGMPYRMNETKPPSAERMEELKRFFEETGIKVKVGG